MEEDMTQTEGKGPASAGMAPGDIAKMAEDRLKDMTGVQKQMLDTMAEMNQRWLSCASAQATLASDLGSKLAGARSLPDVAALYQEWMAQQTKMIAEQNERFLEDTRKVMEAMTRAFPRTWNGGGT
jgi:hypothetical protein